MRRENVSKMDFQGQVLEALVYFASEKGRNRLPTIGQFILSEVIAATIEYLTGEEYRFTYHRSEDGKEYGTVANGWEWKINQAMTQTLEKFSDKLNPTLREALKELTELKFQSDSMGDGGYDSWLYTYYRHFICHSPMISTFSLSAEFIEEVKRGVIPSLDAKSLRHCKAIARLMKKYIKQDVALIKRRYYW